MTVYRPQVQQPVKASHATANHTDARQPSHASSAHSASLCVGRRGAAAEHLQAVITSPGRMEEGMPLLAAAVVELSDEPESASAMDGGRKEGTYLPPGFLALAMLALRLAAAAVAAAAGAAQQSQC